MSGRLKSIRWISRTIVFVLLCSLFMPPSLIKAQTIPSKAYVALGDSVSYGMDADKGKGYVDLLHNYLKNIKKYNGIELVNLSSSGYTSTDLLGIIDSNQDALRKAKVISICVGGNNISYPVITSAARVFGIDYVNNANLISELLNAIDTDPDAELKLFGMIFNKDFQVSLSKWVSAFTSDWTTIIGKVKAITPDAEIYVTTVYNPFNKQDPIHPLIDILIQRINSKIKSSNTGYKIVDIYEEFNKNQYRMSINSSTIGSIVGMHPDNRGHEIIFEAHRRIIPIPVDSITLDSTSKDLVPESVHKLSSTISPSNATNKEIEWTSSNNEAASVDKNGNVTAKAPGSSVIKATVKGTDITASCTINVVIPVQSVSLDKASDIINTKNELQLTASITPSNATVKNLVWGSSDGAIAEVDAKGKVKALNPGTVSITVSTVDGNKTASCLITIKAPVESVSLDNTSTKLKVDKDFQLLATINPSNASSKDVIWKSGDETIASVDANGRVKGLKPGKATVTVTSVDGNKTAECIVTVVPQYDYMMMVYLGAFLLVIGILFAAQKKTRGIR